MSTEINDLQIQQNLQLRLSETTKEFYFKNSSSECLEVLNCLVGAFLKYHETEEFTNNYLRDVVYATNEMGIFITKIHEIQQDMNRYNIPE